MRFYNVKDIDQFLLEAIAWKLSHTVKTENDTHYYPKFFLDNAVGDIDINQILTDFKENIGLYEILDLGFVYEAIDEVLDEYFKTLHKEVDI